MALTEKEAEQLEALLKKKDAPEDDGGGVGKVVNVMIDLGDDEQVRRGLRLGFLQASDLDDDDGDGDDDAGDDAGDDDGEGGDEGPKRGGKRGYFDKKT